MVKTGSEQWVFLRVALSAGREVSPPHFTKTNMLRATRPEEMESQIQTFLAPKSELFHSFNNSKMVRFSEGGSMSYTKMKRPPSSSFLHPIKIGDAKNLSLTSLLEK